MMTKYESFVSYPVDADEDVVRRNDALLYDIIRKECISDGCYYAPGGVLRERDIQWRFDTRAEAEAAQALVETLADVIPGLRVPRLMNGRTRTRGSRDEHR